MAAVRSAQLSHLVGLGDVGGPRRAGGALSPRAGNNDRHGRGLADGAGGRRNRRDDRARLDRAARGPSSAAPRRRGSSARCSSMASRRGRWRASGGRWRQERHERREAGGDHRHRGHHPDRAGSRRAVGRAPAAHVGGPLHHAVRSDRVQVAHRGRGAGLRAHRSHRGAPGAPARPLFAVHHRGDPDGPRRRRARPRPGGPRPRRRDDGHRARRRGARGAELSRVPHRGTARGRPGARAHRLRAARRAATSPSSSAAPAPTPPTR